jgi:uncharacterized protein (DUF305 family)
VALGFIAVAPLAAARADSSAEPLPPAALQATAAGGGSVSDTDPRGPAAMPERVAQVDYEYVRRLMRLPTRELERTFMGEIIPHHAAVVEMSRIALRKARHPEIKTLSRAIIASQSNQIRGFTRILRDKYGVTPAQARRRAPGHIPRILRRIDRHLDRKVADVRAAPAGFQFDQRFLKEVIPHHQTGVLEFQAAQLGAADPQLIVMASMGITGQTAQVNQMLDWLVRWYGE